MDRGLRRLVGFVALSLLAHWFLIVGVPFEMPTRFVGAPPPAQLTARLLPQAKLATPTSPRPRVKPPAAKPAPKVAAPPPAETIPTPTVAAAPVEVAPTSAPASPSADAAPAPPTVAEANPQPAPSAPEQPAEALPEAPVKKLPQKGQMLFTVYYGNNKLEIGQTIQTWEVNGDEYHLTSLTETTGLARLVSKQIWKFDSVGKLTADGLRPQRYARQRVNGNKEENVTADFDWDTKVAMVGNPASKADLPTRTQDILSLQYQMGLLSLAPGSINGYVILKDKIEPYESVVGAEEKLETPLGVLRVLPVTQVHEPGSESMDMWLALDYLMLPVRIRLYQRDGTIEQVIKEIRVSNE